VKKTLFVVMLYVCGVAASGGVEKGEEYLALIMPDNVTLGITRDAIQSARPEAKDLNAVMGSRNINAVVLTELKGENLPLVSYQYHFVDERLRAVIKGIGHGKKRDEQTVRHIHDAIAKDLVKQADEKILRLNTEIEQVLAELWKDEKSGECVYFVDTSNDTSVIVFDPNYFGKRDFFISSDEMSEVAPTVENILKTIEEEQKNSRAFND